jgi:hypothetical protein
MVEFITQKEFVTSLVNNIKEEDDPKKAIAGLADLLVGMTEEDCRNQNKIINMLTELKKDIRGNGNVKTSMLHRVVVLESQMKWVIGVGTLLGTSIGAWLIASLLNLI